MSFGTNLWSAARRQAFELFGPTGLYVVVPDRAAAVTVFEADGTVHQSIGTINEAGRQDRPHQVPPGHHYLAA